MTWTSLVVLVGGSYLLLAGLAIGSFVNLAADRLPRGESLLRPASHCTACGRRLNVIDLLPVLGYFIRGGRCATCRAPIGFASPVVEASCGALMVLPLVWTPGWLTAFAGVSLTTGFGAGVILVAMLRRSRPGPQPDAARQPVRLAR